DERARSFEDLGERALGKHGACARSTSPYIFGSARTTHAELIAHLAETARVTVVAPEYRLLPEHPYPAPLEDALAVFDALTTRGYAAEDIVLAGDSAGGTWRSPCSSRCGMRADRRRRAPS